MENGNKMNFGIYEKLFEFVDNSSSVNKKEKERLLYEKYLLEEEELSKRNLRFKRNCALFIIISRKYLENILGLREKREEKRKERRMKRRELKD